MEEIQRLRVKRRGLKGSITKLLSKVEEALTAELETVNVDSTMESKRILVATTVEQLRMKLEQVVKFDNSIADLIQEESELETGLRCRYVSDNNRTASGYVDRTFEESQSTTS